MSDEPAGFCYVRKGSSGALQNFVRKVYESKGGQ